MGMTKKYLNISLIPSIRDQINEASKNELSEAFRSNHYIMKLFTPIAQQVVVTSRR